MNREERSEAVGNFGTLLLVGAVGIIAARLLIGCHQHEAQFPSYCYDDAAFTAKHVSCATKARTREESQACGDDVDRSCGITTTRAAGR